MAANIIWNNKNNSTFVIKISNDPSIPGVTHNLVIPNSGVDTNDNICLTTCRC